VGQLPVIDFSGDKLGEFVEEDGRAASAFLTPTSARRTIHLRSNSAELVAKSE